MNHRRLLIALGAGVAVASTTLAFGSLMAGCADYSSDRTPGAGGAGTGGTTPSGGQGTGGGSAGLPATGGTGAGQGGTMTAGGGAGLSGSGGAGPAGSGGTGPAGSGGAAPAGSGGDAAGGSAGSAGGGVMASCDSVTPCAGDVVGTWTVAGACVKVSGEIDLSGLGTDCQSSPVSGTLAVTGTFTTKADGTFTDETMTTGDEMLDLPQTCLTLSGTATTCKRIGGPLASVGFSKVTCVDNTTTMGCTCTATVEQTGGLGLVSSSPAASGTYTVADNVLSLSDGVHETLYPSCGGATLTVSPPSMAKTGTYAGTIVLQKQ
jgi:hypothetical protein